MKWETIEALTQTFKVAAICLTVVALSYFVYNKSGKPAMHAENEMPVVSATSRIEITQPLTMVTLSAAATDDQIWSLSYRWEKYSGPIGGYLLTPHLSKTIAYNLAVGSYMFMVTATDKYGDSSSTLVQVIVFPEPTFLDHYDAAGPGQDNVDEDAKTTTKQLVGF